MRLPSGGGWKGGSGFGWLPGKGRGWGGRSEGGWGTAAWKSTDWRPTMAPLCPGPWPWFPAAVVSRRGITRGWLARSPLGVSGRAPGLDGERWAPAGAEAHDWSCPAGNPSEGGWGKGPTSQKSSLPRYSLSGVWGQELGTFFENQCCLAVEPASKERRDPWAQSLFIYFLGGRAQSLIPPTFFSFFFPSFLSFFLFFFFFFLLSAHTQGYTFPCKKYETIQLKSWSSAPLSCSPPYHPPLR